MPPDHPNPLPRIRFEFDEEKAAAAAAILLERASGRMNYMKLVKLLYLAERRSLELYDRPIFGDNYVNMKFGPVLSIVYDLIRSPEEDPGAKTIWHKYIERAQDDRFCLVLRQFETREVVEALSQAEMDLLQELFDAHRGDDHMEMSRFTHALPEWEDPAKHGQKSQKLHPENLLEKLGKSREAIEEIAQSAVESEDLARLFGD